MPLDQLLSVLVVALGGGGIIIGVIIGCIGFYHLRQERKAHQPLSTRTTSVILRGLNIMTFGMVLMGIGFIGWVVSGHI